MRRPLLACALVVLCGCTDSGVRTAAVVTTSRPTTTSATTTSVPDTEPDSTTASTDTTPDTTPDTDSPPARPTGGRGPGGPPQPSVAWPPYEPLPGVSGFAALTGLPVDDATAARPIVAVKVDNHRLARGQWGLDAADVVFEENVESLTRFIALFQSRQPAEVGPVRSARTTDVHVLSAMNRPVLVWSGGNSGVTALMVGADTAGVLVNLSALAKGRGCYRREASRPAPHNLIAAIGCVRGHEAAAGPARPLWGFEPLPSPAPAPTTAPSSTTPDTGTLPAPAPPTTEAFTTAAAAGAPEGAFDVPMDGVAVQWVWDASLGRYLRWTDGAPHRTVGGVQLSATTVVVMYCRHVPSPVDRRTPEPQTTGSGRVAIHAGGKVILGTWSRANDRSPWVFTDDAGVRILLPRGTTFVELARA